MVPCWARVITVDDDGPADFNNIQAAIDDANDGDIVEVQPGIYTGNGNRDIDFLGKPITLRSTDANDPNIVSSTIIDCNGSEAEPHRAFYFHNNEDGNSVLNGFKITGGYASDTAPEDTGGGIRCYNSNPTIANCAIVNNSADRLGGGIYCEWSTPNIANCTFSGNWAGAAGGGMANWNSSSSLLANCIFIGNSALYDGGGVANSTFSNPIFKKCTISGNSAGYDGGGVRNVDSSSPILTNCIISGNLAGHKGGGLYSSGPINGCTVTGNWAGGNGGGLAYCYELVNNCIVWGNLGEQIYPNNLFVPITYSDVQGGWPGLGNSDIDPCFVEPGYWDANGTPNDVNDDRWVDGDYHLRSVAGRLDASANIWVIDGSTSPCIDAGNPGCPLGDEPADANNARINMGAYGGTNEASKTPADWRSIADLTNDWVVDLSDLAVFVDFWLVGGECIPSDLSGNGSVGFVDFSILADEWGW